MSLKLGNYVLLLCFLNFGALVLSAVEKFKTEKELERFLNTYFELNATQTCTESAETQWNYSDDVGNKEKADIATKVSVKNAKIGDYYYKQYFEGLDPDDYESETLQRIVKQLTERGDSALPTDQYKKLTGLVMAMSDLYSTAKICPFTKQACDLKTEGLSLEPEITDIMAKSRDIDELAYVWRVWRDATGKKIVTNYTEYVTLKNEAAVANGYKDAAEGWKSKYEMKEFETQLSDMWTDLEPLYNNLHTYVMNKLKAFYGDKIDVSDGLIPANLLGNMFAQNWEALMPIVMPYPDEPAIDLTATMKAKNFTVAKIFENANKFYKSLGLEDMTMAFGNDSTVEKPTDREIECHPAAWDFCNGKTFRIHMCATVESHYFNVIYHELGHIQYDIQYKDLPYTVRTGASPAFHEAIGDMILLSAYNPVHLKKIGLAEDFEDSDEANINMLMAHALKSVGFLPFGYIIDKWRWDVFSGEITEDEYNDRWWHYRKTIQKVKPPVARSDTDFDAGSKYHVPGDSHYISYFLAHILKFQMYRGLCIAAKKYNPLVKNPKPLHKCDFYKSKKAGKKLKAGLALGASVHWSKVLEKMTDEDTIDVSAMLDYFEPLLDFLKSENKNSDSSEEKPKEKNKKPKKPKESSSEEEEEEKEEEEGKKGKKGKKVGKEIGKDGEKNEAKKQKNNKSDSQSNESLDKKSDLDDSITELPSTQSETPDTEPNENDPITTSTTEEVATTLDFSGTTELPMDAESTTSTEQPNKPVPADPVSRIQHGSLRQKKIHVPLSRMGKAALRRQKLEHPEATMKKGRSGRRFAKVQY